MKFNLSKEFKIGLFSLIAGVVLYLGFNFLKGSNMFSTSKHIYAVFDDVQGLVISSPVLVNGLNVGRVSELKLSSAKADSKVIATLELDNKELILTKGTFCTLVSTDLLGGKALRLTQPSIPGTPLGEEDTIRAEVEKAFTDELADQVAPMISNLDSVSGEVKVLLRSFRKTTTILEGTMLSFKNTADASNQLLASNKGSITTITKNAASLSGQLLGTQKELDVLLLKFGRFGDSLNRMKLATTVANLNKSIEGLNGVLKDVNAGKGSLGKLTKNDSLYTNLNKSSEALDALLIDMKAHPGRYIHFSVFGKKEKKN
jgi:phospholipid/cholesterol/gamma-HCH transport system substrate-binding protein